MRGLHDGLTGLASRTLLIDRTEHALARIERGGIIAAVVVDLDGFAEINATYGIAVGDDVLVEAATRLRGVGRAGDTVARLGADRFVLLLEDFVEAEDAVQVAQRAVRDLARPMVARGQEILVTACAGVATYEGGEPAEQAGPTHELLRNADEARVIAKKRGRNQVAVFDPSVRVRALDRLDLYDDVRAALEAGQIQVLYQPVVDLGSGLVRGFEALARWHHPSRGVIGPGTFIPLAEESGAIIDVGRHVLSLACAQLSDWSRRTGTQGYDMGVNLTVRQLYDAAVVDDVATALGDSRLAPNQLILEVGETAVVGDVAGANLALGALHRLGVRLAIDDFGTGPSSLATLRRMHFDVVKFERSFLTGDDAKLLAGLIGITDALELTSVAEGIEDERQLELARAAGCQRGQGFHLGMPLTADEATDLLDRQPVRAPNLAAPINRLVVPRWRGRSHGAL